MAIEREAYFGERVARARERWRELGELLDEIEAAAADEPGGDDVTVYAPASSWRALLGVFGIRRR